MTNTEKLVALGRFMIKTAPLFANDVQFNTWARVGQLLTEVGTPFGKMFHEFSPEDIAVVHGAAAVAVGKATMPEQMAPVVPKEPRRTRKPRMTQVMRKPQKPKTTVKSEGKRRGRPPGSKNKAKTS